MLPMHTIPYPSKNTRYLPGRLSACGKELGIPKKNKEDQQDREAMAARGYWQSTLVVMKGIERILQNENAGEVANDNHGVW